MQILIRCRKATRSHTYDFLLKGLIFCHECGYPLAVINRKNARGEDRLFFICRTYQRFTKAGVCTCHSIKEQTVTDAVIEKVREVCTQYLQAEQLLPLAEQALTKRKAQTEKNAEIDNLKTKIEAFSAHLDRMYLDKLSGLLAEQDFDRIYRHVKSERAMLEQRLKEMEKPDFSPARQADLAKELVSRFLDTAAANRELLVSLIERVELTEEKNIIIKFRFKQLQGYF